MKEKHKPLLITEWLESAKTSRYARTGHLCEVGAVGLFEQETERRPTAVSVSAVSSVNGPLFTVFPCILLGVLHEFHPVFTVLLGQVGPQRMLRLRAVHHRNQTANHIFSSCGGLPVLDADDGQAHLALLVDVGVVDFRLERDLRWLEGVLGGEDELNAKCSFVIRSTIGNEEALPVQNIRFIHLNVAEIFGLTFANVFQLLV